MKTIIVFCLFVTACISSGSPVPKYICDDGIERTDASEFVLSGEYYFNCKIGLLVRRIPLKISDDEILRLKIEIRKTHDARINDALTAFLKTDGWEDGFEYTCSYIVRSPETKIFSHVFKKIIRIADDRFVITLSKGVFRNKYALNFMSIKDLSSLPNYKTYEQLKEEAKNSCDAEQ